jgi:4-hydroxy-2,2'-bipyrrole-5-carbaldehyde O-methyltransferase
MMRLGPVLSMLKSGTLFAMLICRGLSASLYRLCYLASIADSPVFNRLSRGPVTRAELQEEYLNDTSQGDAWEAWLDLGINLGVIKRSARGYSLRGFLSRKLATPENDALRALIRETTILHHRYLMETPEKLAGGRLWEPAEMHRDCSEIIARSSKALEPFLLDLIDDAFPSSGAVNLLEAGCGHAGYIIHAAGRNRDLRALGLEIDPGVAETARHAVERNGLSDRVVIMNADVRDYRTGEDFDIVTLYNNIYYFPVDARVDLLMRMCGYLRPGGMMLLTTGCRKGGIEFELVNAMHAATKGWGRLPDRAEMIRQMEAAGFERISTASLVPGDKYYAFMGRKPL